MIDLLDPTPSRVAALNQLKAFLPRVERYAAERNFDLPQHPAVSKLSPFIRRRVLHESEVITTTLNNFSVTTAEKFVQEVFWRTYWKGWLELNPQVWRNYVSTSEALFTRHSTEAAYLAAINGETQLTFFNDWVHELKRTGYLHNHTRMWFASVWIFTLQLPWQLGAHFMYTHLLDADPASNTLSWRWVAGLQTKGKVYLATADNIAKFSNGRWQPRPGDLAESAEPIIEGMTHTSAELHTSIASLSGPQAGKAEGLTWLVHEDDLLGSFYDSNPGDDRFLLLRSQNPRVALCEDFSAALLADAAARLKSNVISNHEEIASSLTDLKVRELYCMLPRVGYERDEILSLQRTLAAQHVTLHFVQDEWDARYHHMAQRGYFPFWQAVRKQLAEQKLNR